MVASTFLLEYIENNFFTLQKKCTIDIKMYIHTGKLSFYSYARNDRPGLHSAHSVILVQDWSGKNKARQNPSRLWLVERAVERQNGFVPY